MLSTKRIFLPADVHLPREGKEKDSDLLITHRTSYKKKVLNTNTLHPCFLEAANLFQPTDYATSWRRNVVPCGLLILSFITSHRGRF